MNHIKEYFGDIVNHLNNNPIMKFSSELDEEYDDDEKYEPTPEDEERRQLERDFYINNK